MDDENSNVSTAGADKEKRKQNKQGKESKTQKAAGAAQSVAKNKKVLKFIIAHAGVFITIAVILLIILLIIGFVGYFTSLPGMWIEKVKEASANTWQKIQGWISGDNVSVTITDDQQVQLAQHIHEMGYDIVGYGFADAQYEHKVGEEDSEEREGFAQNGNIITIEGNGKTGTNYLKTYIAKSEATYFPTTWSLEKFFGGVIGIFGIGDEEANVLKSEGMININNEDGVNIEIDRENRLLAIKQNFKATYYYDMSNWTSRYGRPQELFLALHIATMMPDLTYDLATKNVFNTKVNIELQKLNGTFEVKLIGENGSQVLETDILKLFLSKLCHFTDEEISRFEEADKLYEAFEAVQDLQKPYLDGYIGAQDGDIIRDWEHSYINGIDVRSVENKVLETTYTPQITVNKKKRHSILYGYHQGKIPDGFAPDSNELDRNYWYKTESEKIGRITRCYDLSSEGAEVERALEGTVLGDFSAEQVKALWELMIEGKKVETVYLPRIENVVKHWFYKPIEFKYGQAKMAKKTVSYGATGEDDPLASVSGYTIQLDQTLVSPNSKEGIFYQLCEPELDGPNDAIIALFKGGSGEIRYMYRGKEQKVEYDLPGNYYRYDGTRDKALKIANAKAHDEGKTTYSFQGEERTTIDPSNEDMKVEKEEVTFYKTDAEGNNIKTDALAALSILGNTHSEEAEWSYRLLKELLIKLDYFTREDFQKPLNQVLLWPIETIGTTAVEKDEDGLAKGLYKDDDKYGLFLKVEEAFQTGNSVIAPGDAEVINVSGDSITLKFKSLSDATVERLKTQFGTDYKEPKRDIVLDMTMTISGIKVSASAGSTVTEGETIGLAGTDDIRIVMNNIDKSNVDDIETYTYPTYVGTDQTLIYNHNGNIEPPPYVPDGGNEDTDGNTDGNATQTNPEYHGENYCVDMSKPEALPSLSEAQLREIVSKSSMSQKAKENMNSVIPDLIRYEDEYNVNAVFFMAVARAESQWGTAWAAIDKSTYNWCSIKGSKNGGYVDGNGTSWNKYTSFSDATKGFCNLIANGSYYYNAGRYTVTDIAPTYCNASWGVSVCTYIKQFYNSIGIEIESVN